MSDPLMVGVNKLSLRSGDVVMVQVSPFFTLEQAALIRNDLQSMLPAGVQCFVVARDFNVTVFRNGEMVAPETDPPLLLEAR